MCTTFSFSFSFFFNFFLLLLCFFCQSFKRFMNDTRFVGRNGGRMFCHAPSNMPSYVLMFLWSLSSVHIRSGSAQCKGEIRAVFVEGAIPILPPPIHLKETQYDLFAEENQPESCVWENQPVAVEHCHTTYVMYTYVRSNVCKERHILL